jgi:hypothetical protein
MQELKNGGSFYNDRIGIAFLNRKAYLKSQTKPPPPPKKEEEEEEEEDDGGEEELFDRGFCGNAIDKFKDVLTAMYLGSRTYIHCEIAFFKKLQHRKPGDNNCLAFGVVLERGVFQMERSFSKGGYSWIFLKVTPAQILNMYVFCMDLVAHKEKYDGVGVQRSKIWPKFASNKKRDGWWCNLFVTEVLQSGGFFTTVVAETLEIDDMYHLLENHEKRFIGMSSPFEKEKANKEWVEKMVSPNPETKKKASIKKHR